MLDEFLKGIDRLSWDIRPYIPFVALNTVWRYIDRNSRSILDIGCGKGQPMRFINRRKRFFTIGADIFEPYLRQCRERNIHDDYLLCDARNLPLKDKSFDTVLCLEMLEHLEKEDGQKLLQAMERIARLQIIITTPVGIYRQRAFDGNPHQEHKSVWHPRELEALGYKVRGCGLRKANGLSGSQSPLPKVLRPWMNAVWVSASPFSYFLPNLAGDMVCIKTKRPEPETNNERFIA